MFNSDLKMNFNIPSLSDIDALSIPDAKQFQIIPSFSSMNFILDEEGIINSKENIISPQFKTISIDNNQLKENKNEPLDNICEINKGDKISIITEREKEPEPVKPFKLLKTKFFKVNNSSNTVLNQKRKNNSNGKHNKFSEDNLQRKCITIILNISLEFINKRIKQIYNGNIGKGVNCKELLSINMKPYFYTVDFIKSLLHKTLGEIFSDKISMKYTNYLSNYNILMIKSLLNEKEQDKNQYLEKLFGITFIQCVKKFVGIYNSEELEEFITFNEYKEKLNEDSNYLKILKNYFINFEENVNKKKSKTRKKITNNTDKIKND